MRRMSRRPATSRAGVASTVSYGTAHLKPFIGPWAAWAGLPVVGTLTHAMAAASVPAGVAVGGATAAGVLGLAAFTHHAFKARTESIRAHATATVVAAGAWSLWATAAGLWQTTTGHGWNVLAWALGVFNPWPWGAWFLLGPIACLTWNIRRLSRGDGTDTHTTDGSGLLEKVGLAGRVKRAELEAGGNRVAAEIEVARGTHTIEDLQKATGRLASELAVRPSAIRVIPNPDDAARGTLYITPRDLLKETISWPGPSAPGESIALPIPAGRYEDGDTPNLYFPGDPTVGRNAVHLALSGMSGAGKTESGLCVVADAMTRPDFSIVFSDHVKHIQTYADIAPGCGLILGEHTAAVAAMRQLQTVISERTGQLGRHGFKQWTPAAALPEDQGGADIRFLVYWIEESASLVADSTRFVQITEQARSAGIGLVLSQQRLSHDRIDTSARANLGAMWCFGVKNDRERFGLSDETFEAGAAPWTWQAYKPGRSYLEHVAIPQDRWSMAMKGFLSSPGHVLEVAREFGNPTLDPTTGRAFGKVYTDYQRRVAEGAADWQAGDNGRVAIAAPANMPQLTDTAAGDELHVDDDEEFEDHPDLPPLPVQPEPGFMDDIDPSVPIADDDEDDEPLTFTPPPARKPMGTDEARAALRHLLTKMAERGDETVRPQQLVEFRQFVGRGAPWLTKELRRLAEDQVITIEPENGAYGIRPLARRELADSTA